MAKNNHNAITAIADVAECLHTTEKKTESPSQKAIYTFRTGDC